MTAKEFHIQEIVPLRLKLKDLEDKYYEMYRKECGDKVGAVANCGNCAYSCVIYTSDHNECMGGKCTCCNSFCYHWIPENEVSGFIRDKYHHNSSIYRRLEDLFGDCFLKECDSPDKLELVMEALKLIARFDGKFGDDDE